MIKKKKEVESGSSSSRKKVNEQIKIKQNENNQKHIKTNRP